MDSEKTISLESDAQTRKGVFANMVKVERKEGLVQIDFFNCDVMDEDESRAVLSSRVILSSRTARELGKLLDPLASDIDER